jgi:hypothetical protein
MGRLEGKVAFIIVGVHFLASDEASSVTGTAMSVDQGTVNK